MSSIHRRHWIKQSALVLTGLGLSWPALAAAPPRHRFANNDTPIRLSGNENPFGPSPLARAAMAEAISRSNRYPFDRTLILREAIGKTHGLTADHVLMGAGSSEILGLVAQLAAQQRGQAILADPTFGIWVPAAERQGLGIIRVPLTAEKVHDLPAMLERIDAQTRLFYLCNPNNPTGTLLPAPAVREAALLAARQAIVLVDEAYLEYTDEPTQTPLVQEHPNIIVVKTFSKIYGLAGARIGYALAHPDTIKKLGSLQPWNNAGVSAVSVAGALASLEDRSFIEYSKTENRRARAYTATELSRLGLAVIHSHTNFLYYSLGAYRGNWTEELKTSGILAGRISEPKGQWTRTTIGTADEMRRFIQAAQLILHA